MATNGIEILINVAAQQGIATLDEFTKILSDAAGKAKGLSGSIDGLDAALVSVAKGGMSAEDMAAKLVTTLEDFGIQVKDADVLASTLEKTLTGLGVSGAKAASGVDLATKANESLAGSSDTATAAVDRESSALARSAAAADLQASAMKGAAASRTSSLMAEQVATADLGKGYTRMASTAGLATPALMKAATWAGLGLAGLAYEGIKQYTLFNKLITQTITQAGIAPSKMGFLSGLAESVAKSTGQHLNDVANTIYRVASGTASWNSGLGATNKQLSNIVTTVSKLNVVGGLASGAESEQASRVVTALVNANIRGVGKDPVRAAALVNAVVGSGDMRYADLVPGIGRGLLASAVANNVTAQDTMAWVATLTSQGTTASVAGNYVKTGINLVMHPSAQGVQALAMLGIKPGELENLAQGPGGMTAALSTLKAGMNQLNPGNAATFFFHKAGEAYPGGTGLKGAVAKLQTWSAGELSPQFIKDWEANKLTPLEHTQAADLILTKAFGGSKQFATVAGVINNLSLYKGIQSHITAENTPGYFNAQYRRTAATPSQQFKVMGQHIMVDLVNIGKTLTPLGLTFGHIISGVIGALTKFKGVLYSFALIAGGLLAAAGYGKLAELGTHLSPLIGAGYNRLGVMAGKDSAFTKSMLGRANSGGAHFLNIYDTHKSKILSKLGGDAINAGFMPSGGVGAAALSADGAAVETSVNRGNLLLAEIATNTRMTAGAAEAGSLGGGGGMSGVGGGKGALFKDSRTGRWTQRLSSGRTTFISNAEAMGKGRYLRYPQGDIKDITNLERNGRVPWTSGMNGPMFYDGNGRLRAPSSTGVTADNAWISANKRAAESPLMLNAGSPIGTAASDARLAPTIVSDVAKTGGMLAGAGEMLGGLAGGPMGMMAMMAAPVIVSALTPVFGKLGSLLGGWLSGGSQSTFHPNLHNPLDTQQASAKVSKKLAALRQFQTKNAKGKWVRNNDAFLANPVGYRDALKKYQLATHTYQGSVKNSKTTIPLAISDLYGSASHLFAQDLGISKRISSSHIGSDAYIRGLITDEPRMTQLASQLPPLMRASVMNMMYGRHRNSQGRWVGHGPAHYADWSDFSKIIKGQKTWAHGVFGDFSGSSAQSQGKLSGMGAALIAGGYFNTKDYLSKNTSDMNRFLNNKHNTVAEVAQTLPGYAHKMHIAVMKDNTALLQKNLPADARKYYQDQKNISDEQLKKTDALIREMRAAAKDTHLAGESVSKLSEQISAHIKKSGLSKDIADAISAALSPYIKNPTVLGTSGPVGRTKPNPTLTGANSFGL
jgi:hypothetical protein